MTLFCVVPHGLTASCAKHSSGPSGPCATQVLCSPQLRDTAQMGSLAGAAHLLQDNAGVPKHCSGGTETPHRGAGQRHC